MRGILRRAASFGVATGLLGVALTIVPAALELEESLGLGWLFVARGPVPPPEDVAVVSVSAESAIALGQSEELDEWPRSLHAELIGRLVELGSGVIVFDVFFDEPRPEHDHTLGIEIREAGNVILAERVRSEPIAVEGPYAPANAVVETRIPPIPEFKDGALATAPFTLPAFPQRVGQFWTFGRGVGDTPSLPVVALQAHLLPQYERLLATVRSVRPDTVVEEPPGESLRKRNLTASVRGVRGVFRDDASLAADVRARWQAEGLEGEPRRRLEALLDVYAGPESRYLNYYGPARTIRTLPYHEMFRGADTVLDLAGKVVFVGFSENRQPEQQDWFYSVFSERTGQNLSGVEIGATAFANLLEGTSVKPLTMPAHLTAVFIWGLLIGVLFVALPAWPALAGGVGAGALYGAAAYAAFRIGGLWFPLAVPLLIQLPAASFAGLLWNYHRVRLQRERIRTALGYYVPARLANQLTDETLSPGASSELLYGTCLFTDAEQYTSVAEAMRPEELGAFMNEYYRAMFSAVERHDGLVSDVAGDSMVAVWAAAQSDPQCRVRACRAAVDVVRAVRDFNQTRGRHELPTRVGLDAGQVLLGNVGAQNRYEYRAVGDIVSTASRIQGLNRMLGTQILASDSALAGVGGFVVRDIGTFLLRGKTASLRLHELLRMTGKQAHASEADELLEEFAVGLEAFRAGEWSLAARVFGDLSKRFPNDGPSRYYHRLSESYRNEPPAEWHGVVPLAVK